jgi:hypothetical protein
VERFAADRGVQALHMAFALTSRWSPRGLREMWRKTCHDEPVRAWLGAPLGLSFAIPALPFALLARVPVAVPRARRG